MISNVGPIGCIPYQRILNELNDEDCVDLANDLATQYNARLKDLVAELNDNLPGATFVLANVYDLVSELIVNYRKYGNNLVLEINHCITLRNMFMVINIYVLGLQDFRQQVEVAVELEVGVRLQG